MAELRHKVAQATYESGEWMAVTGPDLWLLLDQHPNAPMVSDIWGVMKGGGRVDVICNLLAKDIDGQRSNFGLVACIENELVIRLSGSAVAIVERDGISESLNCPSAVSVVEYRISAPLDFVEIKGGTTTDESRFPIHSGAARASSLRLKWGADLASEITVPELLQDVIPNDAGGPLFSALEDTASAGLTLPAVPDPTQIENEAEVEPDDCLPQEAVSDDGEFGSYDHLFGQTMALTVEDAAVRNEASGPTAREVEVPAPESLANDTNQIEETEYTNVADAGIVNLATEKTGLIDVVPWTSRDAGGNTLQESSPKASEPVAPNDDAEFTVNRAAHARLLNQLAAPGSLSLPGPVVHAVRCPSKHTNPVHAGACRVCGSTIVDQDPVTIPRPVLGCLRLSTGDEVTLDRSVLMGRRPVEGRLVDGERPHLVKVASPNNDISRSHLEIRLDGWHVLITDLHSTNGTVITLPGREPERLRPDQPAMIEPGSVVVLADEVSFTYEVSG
jgi:hypothetical protein